MTLTSVTCLFDVVYSEGEFKSDHEMKRYPTQPSLAFSLRRFNRAVYYFVPFFLLTDRLDQAKNPPVLSQLEPETKEKF